MPAILLHDLLGDPIAVHDTFAQPHCLRAPMIGSRRFILGEWLTYEIPLVNAIGPRGLETKGGAVALDDPARAVGASSRTSVAAARFCSLARVTQTTFMSLSP